MQLRPVAVDVRGRPSQGEGVQNNLMCAAQLVITEAALAAPNGGYSRVALNEG